MSDSIHKEMRAISDSLASRKILLEKAIADGNVAKKKIDDDAAAKKAAIDAHIRAVSNGESESKHA